MGSHYWHDLAQLTETYGCDGGSICANLRNEDSLVLDVEIGGLVNAQVKHSKKGSSNAKNSVILRNHSEAEKRRRERINGHLSTLRGLVPCTEKMDKAAVLAETISQLNELKKIATDASKGHLIPMDANEARVEEFNDGPDDVGLYFKASLCCNYRFGLLSDLKQALYGLPLQVVSMEISTLGCWVKCAFVFTQGKEVNRNHKESCRLLAGSVQRALMSVMDKGSGLSEFSPRVSSMLNKRSRVSFLESSSSSS